MKLKLTLFLLIMVAFGYSSNGQVSSYGASTEQYEVTSAQGRTYVVTITLPKNYNSVKEYKTLYYLDAWWLNEVVRGSYTLLTVSGYVEDVVLVGISSSGGEKEWNSQRSMDFTPAPYDKDLVGLEMNSGRGEYAIELNENTSGGSELFISFLADSLISSVEDKHPNLSLDRCLLGHSFGGLFAFDIIQKRPGLFSSYIIISPSLWWNGGMLVQEDRFSASFKNDSVSSLHFSYGGKESGLIKKPCVQMDGIIQKLETPLKAYEHTTYATANHNSILPLAIYDGLLFTFGKER